MVPFGVTASTQIRFLLQSLNDSNLDSVFHSLSQFIDSGLESSILLLQTCFDQHRHHENNNTSIQNPNHTLLATIIRYLLSRPNFSTVLCESLRASTDNVKTELLNVSGFVLGPMLNDLDFTVPERIAFGLAFSDFEDVEVKSVGQSFCISHIEELCEDNDDGSGITDCSSERIQSIVLFLTRTEGVSAKLVDKFLL